MAAASAATAAVPHATPMPALAPTLSPGSLVEPELWMLFELSTASVSGVPVVVAVDAGVVAAEVETPEVRTVDVAVLVLVSETVETGRLVMTLPGGSEKTSETPLQSQTSSTGHPLPHPPMPWQQKFPLPQLTTPYPISVLAMSILSQHRRGGLRRRQLTVIPPALGRHSAFGILEILPCASANEERGSQRVVVRFLHASAQSIAVTDLRWATAVAHVRVRITDQPV
jgi:hypothetical protein